MKKWIIPGIAAVLTAIAAIAVKMRNSFSVGIIGGADGPTAIFVTGSAVNGIMAALTALAAVLATVAVCLWLRKRKK